MRSSKVTSAPIKPGLVKALAVLALGAWPWSAGLQAQAPAGGFNTPGNILITDQGNNRVLELDCNQGDQLTRELQEFIRCVQTGTSPRVSGRDGLEAVALAGRILDCIHAHSWDGRLGGPTGPKQFPPPLGPLFQPTEREAAA